MNSESDFQHIGYDAETADRFREIARGVLKHTVKPEQAFEAIQPDPDSELEVAIWNFLKELTTAAEEKRLTHPQLIEAQILMAKYVTFDSFRAVLDGTQKLARLQEMKHGMESLENSMSNSVSTSRS